MENRKPAIAALLGVQVLFAFFPIASKIIFREMELLSLMAIRLFGAAVLMVIATKIWVKTPVPFRKEWRMLGLLTVMGVIGNQTLFLLGLERTTAINASLEISTIPVFTYAIAVIFGKETLGPRRAVGILLALAGAIYLIGHSQFNAGWETAIGDLMIIINCILFSAYLVFSKPLLQKYDAISVTTWTFVLAAIAFLPVAWIIDAPSQWASLSVNASWWVVFVILGPSVGTYLLNAFALRHVNASTVAVFIYIQPVLTTLLAWWLLGEEKKLELLPAAVAVFTGVWFVARPRRTPATSAPQDNR